MQAAENKWPEVMDLVTAAKYMGFHPVTLREWKRKGDGPPGKKIGGRWRFLKAALDSHITGIKQPVWPAHLIDSNPVVKKASSGYASRRQVDEKYLEALGLSTERSQLNGHRKSTRNITELLG